MVEQYIIVIILYILAYIYSLEFAVSTNNKSIIDVHESCIIPANNLTKPLLTFRGKNYYISKNKSATECLATFWSVGHYLFYALLGFIAPGLFKETLIIGILFELYESRQFDCHDALDIVFNSAGFLSGRFLRDIII